MTTQLAPRPLFRDWDNNGNPLVGGQLFSFIAGTSTPQATWTDSTQSQQNTNPVILNSRGEASVWLDPTLTYKLVLQDSVGNQIWSQDNIVGGYVAISQLSVYISQSYIGQTLWPQTPQEIAANVTPTTYIYPPGDLRRYGGSGDGGTSDDTTAVQNAINANAGAYTVYVPNGGNFYKLTARVSVPANTHILLEEGAELRWTATTANGTNFLGAVTRPGFDVLGGNFCVEGRGKLTGPGTAAANSGTGGGGVTAIVSQEFCILCVGPSATNRTSGIVVRDVEISLWGQSGIITQFCQNIQIVGCTLHDLGYSGMQHLSAQTVREYYNVIYGIAPGISANAYGISHTHDSTNYSSDPNVTSAPRQTVNPFCIDMDCAYNVVRDIPLWSAFDAHGCYEGRYHHNTVYNCHRGFQISSSSGAGANYAGENNRIESNVIYSQQINGNATTDGSGFQAGIVINGGSTISHRSVWVRDNTLVGMGHASTTPSVFCIEATFVNDAVIAGNTLRACVGRGIYAAASSQILVADNVFDSMGASSTGGQCIYMDSNDTNWTVARNKVAPVTGTLTTWPIGLNLPGSGYGRSTTIANNDFTACTTPYTNLSGTQLRNQSEWVPQISDTTTGSHTIDVSVCGAADRILVLASQGSAATLTSLLNPVFIGQEVTICMTGSNTLTVNNSGNIKLQGGTVGLTASSTLRVVWDGVKWQENARAVGNT